MSNTTGPYPADLGFERWQDQSPIFEQQVTESLTAVVNYLPGLGWGCVLLVGGVVVAGKYNQEWTAEMAMTAALYHGSKP